MKQQISKKISISLLTLIIGAISFAQGAFATTIYVDDEASGHNFVGDYWNEETSTGYYGDMYWTYNLQYGSSESSSWLPCLVGFCNPVDGTYYQVDAWIPSNYATTGNAHYYHSLGGLMEVVNQYNISNAWTYLNANGTWWFFRGTGYNVELRDTTGEPNYWYQVGADCMRFRD